MGPERKAPENKKTSKSLSMKTGLQWGRSGKAPENQIADEVATIRVKLQWGRSGKLRKTRKRPNPCR